MDAPRQLKVFRYLAELDCFVVEQEFQRICDYLDVTEWHAAVWIGRLFTLDNDFGEHWFDNWDEREALEEKARTLGYDSSELFIIVPARMKDGRDGPCHADEIRKRFWKDVLSSLTVSLELIIEEARHANAIYKQVGDSDVLTDLEARIANVLAGRADAIEDALARRKALRDEGAKLDEL